MTAKRRKKLQDKVKKLPEPSSLQDPAIINSNAGSEGERSFGVLPARDLKKNLGCG